MVPLRFVVVAVVVVAVVVAVLLLFLLLLLLLLLLLRVVFGSVFLTVSASEWCAFCGMVSCSCHPCEAYFHKVDRDVLSPHF